MVASVMICEMGCTTAQGWFAFAFAVSPVMLLISMIVGAIAIFAQISVFRLAFTILPALFVLAVRAVDAAHIL